MSFHNNSTFKLICKIAFSLLVLVLCFLYIDDVSKLPGMFVGVHSGYLLLAFLVNVIGSILIPALITKEALKTDRISLSLLELVKINFSIRFFTIVFPRGVATGVRWYKYQKGGSSKDAFALIVFEKLVQMLILILMAAFFMGSDRGSLPEEIHYIWFASILASIALVICIMPFLSSAFSVKFHLLLNVMQKILPQFIHSRLIRLWEAICVFQKLKGRVIVFIFGLSIISYFLFILSAYILAFAMGIDISFKGIAWIRSVVLLIRLVPITVAGLGVREASYVTFMQLYGVASHEALAFSLLLFAIQIMVGIVGGGTEIWDRYIKSFMLKKQCKKPVDFKKQI